MYSGHNHTGILYADDIMLMFNSLKGLQRHLNALKSFCMNKALSVNLDKTKMTLSMINARYSQ